MTTPTTAFWGMTINNYDDTDLALVQQGYPDFIRKIVYTLERGESGTPHVQAYIRLFRQQRLSYLKKLFPRGSFKALTNDEYVLNAERYAQKQDDTAESPAVIQNNPFPDPVVELTSVMESAMKHFLDGREAHNLTQREVMFALGQEEMHRVREKPRLAKFYVSATYKSVKKQFWQAIALHVQDTYTHTHRDEKLSRLGGITTDGEDSEGGQDDEDSGSEDTEGEGNEDGESGTDEGYSEGSSDQSDAEDDWQGSGE